MKNLDGYNIPFDFDGFVQMSDLIYYDGPLLSHFVSKTAKDYFFIGLILMRNLIVGCFFV